jgi:threonine dehydrogenase-like Zn-dependent dehydrogenase
MKMNMKALIKKDKETLIEQYTFSTLHDITIKVDTAGICRTDIYAAENKIKTKKNLILGHEFTGYIHQSRHKNFKEGDLVVVNPIFEDLTMLGVDHDGCFANFINVSSSKVFHFGSFHDLRIPAYVEPIAASLAPLKSRLINKEMVGAVYGENRIGILTYEIMKKQGYNIVIVDKNNELADNTFDYVIETLATTETFDRLSKLIKKNGVLIMKSRYPNYVSINFYDYVRKEIMIEPLYYHDFQFAIDYAKTYYDDFLYLLGDTYQLEDWKKAFTASQNGNKKIFFKL